MKRPERIGTELSEDYWRWFVKYPIDGSIGLSGISVELQWEVSS